MLLETLSFFSSHSRPCHSRPKGGNPLFLVLHLEGIHTFERVQLVDYAGVQTPLRNTSALTLQTFVCKMKTFAICCLQNLQSFTFSFFDYIHCPRLNRRSKYESRNIFRNRRQNPSRKPRKIQPSRHAANLLLKEDNSTKGLKSQVSYT